MCSSCAKSPVFVHYFFAHTCLRSCISSDNVSAKSSSTGKDKAQTKRSPSGNETCTILREIFVSSEHRNEVKPALEFSDPCSDPIEKFVDATQSTNSKIDEPSRSVFDLGVNLICGASSSGADTAIMYRLGGLSERRVTRNRREDVGLSMSDDDDTRTRNMAIKQ